MHYVQVCGEEAQTGRDFLVQGWDYWRKSQHGKHGSNNTIKWEKLEQNVHNRMRYSEMWDGDGVDKNVNGECDVIIMPHVCTIDSPAVLLLKYVGNNGQWSRRKKKISPLREIR